MLASFFRERPAWTPASAGLGAAVLSSAWTPSAAPLTAPPGPGSRPACRSPAKGESSLQGEKLLRAPPSFFTRGPALPPFSQGRGSLQDRRGVCGPQGSGPNTSVSPQPDVSITASSCCSLGFSKSVGTVFPTLAAYLIFNIFHTQLQQSLLDIRQRINTQAAVSKFVLSVFAFLSKAEVLPP